VTTDDLISLLAAKIQAVDTRLPVRRYYLAVLGATAASTLLMAQWLGVRPTLARDLSAPMFWTKEAFCVALSAAGLAAVLRLARPGRALGWVPGGVAAPLIGIWLVAAGALLAADAPGRTDLFFGQTAGVCPFRIALLSAPVLVAIFWAMKALAPTRLRLAGGFAAGAVGALVYCLHCPELAAPFLGTWYVLGILIPTIIGALIGPRLLRW